MTCLILVLISIAILLIWDCVRINKLEDNIVALDDFLADIVDVLNDIQEKKQ